MTVHARPDADRRRSHLIRARAWFGGAVAFVVLQTVVRLLASTTWIGLVESFTGVFYGCLGMFAWHMGWVARDKERDR